MSHNILIARLLSMLSISILLAVTLVACKKPPSVEEYSDEYFHQLVAERYVAPFREGDVERWLTSFDADAIALHDTRPADKGIESIRAFGEMVHTHLRLAEYEVEVTDIRRSEDWVYTVGEYKSLFVYKTDGQAPWGPSQGKFLLLWERQAEGGWRIIADMGNSNSP